VDGEREVNGTNPHDEEEAYDCALENVLLAFAEFLHVALQVGMVHSCGAMCELNDISHQIDVQQEMAGRDVEHYI